MRRIQLTPKKILQKDFDPKLKGYNPVQVDGFLDIIMQDYITYNKMNSSLKLEVQKLRKRLRRISVSMHKVNQIFPHGLPNIQVQSKDNYHRANISVGSYMSMLQRISNLETRVFGPRNNSTN